MEGALLGDSGSGDVSQPDESASEMLLKSPGPVDLGRREDDETTEYRPEDLRDLEVLPYVPRGMDELLPRGHWSLQEKEELEGSIKEIEDCCSIRASRTTDPEVDDLPSGIPERLVKLYQEGCIRTIQMKDPEVADAMKKTFELSIKMGVPPRAEIQSADEMKQYLDWGVRHFSLGTDVVILYNYWKNEGEKVLRAMEGE